MDFTYTMWVKKTRHPTPVDNFTKYYVILKILSLLDSTQNLLQNDRYKSPPALKDFAALPCETVMFQLLASSGANTLLASNKIRYEMWLHKTLSMST